MVTILLEGINPLLRLVSVGIPICSYLRKLNVGFMFLVCSYLLIMNEELNL